MRTASNTKQNSPAFDLGNGYQLPYPASRRHNGPAARPVRRDWSAEPRARGERDRGTYPQAYRPNTKHAVEGLFAARAQLFAALSAALHNQVREVAAEKKTLLDDAQRMIATIRQMESSLGDGGGDPDCSDDALQITFPLSRCLKILRDKHSQISRLHRERYEQVKSVFLSVRPRYRGRTVV